MCIVIDADVFSSIVNREAGAHSEFEPLIKWISLGKGKVVYGGSEYKKQIKKHRGFRDWLHQLEKSGKTVPIDGNDVDSTEKYLKDNFVRSDYDDHHILAITIVSGCKLVCSSDAGCHSLVDSCYQQEMKKLISRNCPCVENPTRPKIYKNKGHKGLLCDSNIAKCCR
jgi:hypothetical protein